MSPSLTETQFSTQKRIKITLNVDEGVLREFRRAVANAHGGVTRSYIFIELNAALANHVLRLKGETVEKTGSSRPSPFFGGNAPKKEG